MALSGDSRALVQLCGSLIVGGFDGLALPREMATALAEERRAGVILFRRNLPSVEAAHALCGEVLTAWRAASPAPWIAVDEEGGRVQRLPEPALKIPPMEQLARRHDLALVERVALMVGTELSALGFNLNFAPVLDVHSNPINPIIGDRSFGSDPDLVIRMATAYLRGLEQAGVAGSVKHFPGHGDTALDSHFALPYVSHGREVLEQRELKPFRALLPIAPTAMTAHVVYAALDPGVPASKSSKICRELLRDELGFRGVLFSDDLEMKALALHASVEENAVSCIAAGCDTLLICHDFELQERAHAALVQEAERSSAFRARCAEANRRSLDQRSRLTVRRLSSLALGELWNSEPFRLLRAELDALAN